MRNQKKQLKIVTVLLTCLSIVFITACSSQTTNKSTNSGEVNHKIIISEHNFVGSHTGNNTAKNPNYKYSMYFGKNGKFVQDIISSKGFTGRFTEEGTYVIAKNGDVTMTIDSVTEEQFEDDSSLKSGQAPISIVQRKGSTLNAAEDHPIKIENKKTYLLGTVNNVKLHPTNKQTVNYKKHYQSEVNKYDDSYGIFSGHGFTSNGMDTPMNAIAFKNNTFIWRYGYQDENKSENDAVMAVFEGFYSYNASSHIMTLKISNQSGAYYGNLLNLSDFEYQRSGKVLAGDTLKLRYSNNTLALISNDFDSWKMKDSSPDDLTHSYPKYDDYLSKYEASIFEQQMHKGAETSSNEVNSPAGFQKFALEEGLITGTETNLKTAKGDWVLPDEDKSDGFRVANDVNTDGNDSDSSTEITHVHAVYTLFFEGGAVNQVILLGDDGCIYMGNPIGVVRMDSRATEDWGHAISND